MYHRHVLTHFKKRANNCLSETNSKKTQKTGVFEVFLRFFEFFLRFLRGFLRVFFWFLAVPTPQTEYFCREKQILRKIIFEAFFEFFEFFEVFLRFFWGFWGLLGSFLRFSFSKYNFWGVELFILLPSRVIWEKKWETPRFWNPSGLASLKFRACWTYRQCCRRVFQVGPWYGGVQNVWGEESVPENALSRKILDPSKRAWLDFCKCPRNLVRIRMNSWDSLYNAPGREVSTSPFFRAGLTPTMFRSSVPLFFLLSLYFSLCLSLSLYFSLSIFLFLSLRQWGNTCHMLVCNSPCVCSSWTSFWSLIRTSCPSPTPRPPLIFWVCCGLYFFRLGFILRFVLRILFLFSFLLLTSCVAEETFVFCELMKGNAVRFRYFCWWWLSRPLPCFAELSLSFGHGFSGPALRDTVRLSQRYPVLRDMGFSVSQHGQLGVMPPPPFLSVSLLESVRSGGAIPPPAKAVSQRYLPLCDTISKGYCAICGVISHWDAKGAFRKQYARANFWFLVPVVGLCCVV